MRHLLITGILAMLFAPLATAQDRNDQDAPHAASSGADIYIITFSDPGALRYDGNIDGLKATSRLVREKARNKAENPDISAYRAHLNDRIDGYASQMAGTLGRQVEPLLRYNVRFTGMATRLSESEANAIAAMPGVLEVKKDVHYELDTDAGPQWIGADHIWDGSSTPASVPNTGEGVIIGVLDSGVNMDHPSFSDTPEDGHTYVNPLGADTFVGWCNPGNPNHDPSYVCNDKLIGAWDFADITSGGSETDGPEDSNGHGSHTASTAGGNFISGPFTDGGTGNMFDAASISGVARHANLITYDVCVDTCPSSAILGAVDQAILDGVDVFNFSISGGTSPWNDNDRSFLDAFGAGILPTASAGNLGTGQTDPTGLVGHRSPWTMTVANQTHNRVNSNDVSAVGGPSELQDMYGLLGVQDNFTGDVTAVGIYAGNVDAGNFEGCNAWPGGNEFTGAIAVIRRGGCNFSVKIDNAAAAGAVAALIFNDDRGILPTVMGGIETTTIPSLMIGQDDGDALRDHITSNPGTMVTMAGTAHIAFFDSIGSIINSGSLRGPNNFDVTKPDLGGPGTNIFAAYADNIGPAPQYTFLSGTSMSSPHAAGSAALLMSIHPNWSPMEVKSALMMTSRTGKNEAGDPANPDIEGSGTVDLEKAALAGLIMNENFDNMLAANPATGGDPSTLNQPSMRSDDCNGVCSWTRTVCSTLDVETNWTIITPASEGWSLDVPGPNQIDLAPAGQLQSTSFEDGEGITSSCTSFTVEATVTDMALVTAGEWLFSEITLIDNTTGSPDLKMTVSIVPTGIDN